MPEDTAEQSSGEPSLADAREDADEQSSSSPDSQAHEDATLDDFVPDADATCETGDGARPDESGGSAPPDEREDGAPPDEGGNPDGDENAEPATTIRRWEPDGATCEACGATVTALWRDGDRLCCDDCNSW